MKDLWFYLLRHGESTANVDNVYASQRIDAPLSEEGVEQARRVAKWLKSFPISTVYASPLRRAKQTAEIVCAELNIAPVFTDLLVEVDVGKLEGTSQADTKSMAAFEHVMKLWEEGYQKKGFEGGETLLEVKTRLSRLLERIKNNNPANVLLVGHCLLYMAFIWLFCENHGPTLEAGHMGRARLSILRNTSENLRLEKFDLAPPPQDKCP